MAKKKLTVEELTPIRFTLGDTVYLIPDSFNGNYEDKDFADDDWEDLNVDHEYEVERILTVYAKKQDPGVKEPYRDSPITYLSLVHDEICGGSGYWVPAYRFWTKKQYELWKTLSSKK